MKKETHLHPEAERDALRLRLRKIRGQLAAIDRMLAEDCDCAETLTQLVSARRALKSLTEKLIQSHMSHCIEHAGNQRDARVKLRQLLLVLQRYVE